MNKNILMVSALAALLAGCSSDDLSLAQKSVETEAPGVDGAVNFSAYTQRDITRAGYAGVLNNAQLQKPKEQGGGFGVFGYYTDLNEYDQTSTPNFMYNQEVKYSGGSWTYEPIKYWPNEYGNQAQSDDVDKLTFFAYAPYTANTPATGKVTGDDQVGITGFTRNSAAGDPYVKYVGSLDPTQSVDLCWGVCADADKTWNIIQGGSQTLEADFPWLNVQRPQKSLGQKMKFTFKHALAQLNMQIDADVNTNQHGQGSDVNFNSKVYVRSITFNGFAMKGALNLNNEEAGVPNWKGYGCSNEPLQSDEYTIYDGMKDGKEGTGYTASNEKVTGLNPTIIQSKKWSEQAATDGVQKTAKNLFNSDDEDAPIYVIPTGDDLTITIVYDIETADEKLPGTVSDKETAGVSIENRISKTITVTGSTPASALKLEAGKKYTIQLHLGLSQVEFDATVDEWDDAASASGEAWHPGNGDSSGSGTTPTTPTKPQAAIATAPTAVTGLTYSGSAQPLVTAGTSDEGTVQYAIGTASGPTGTYSATIPTATNAGTYYIWYKVAGDADHSDSAPQKLAVTVAKADATLTLAAGDLGFASSDKAETAKTNSITAKAGDKTVTVSSADNTKCNVAISGTTITVTRKSTDAFSDVVITVTLTGDANHNNATATFKVSAEKCDTNMSAGSSINNWTTASENITVTEKP